ncbi:hypothetical protein LCGC14_1016000 [marine sediment metagenome]|uniref:Uncharacterized protein n=1 Tax=marine sediment metagenome TaxID=412755 RepID=A0A0F9QH03_9ZZZZ
MNPLTTSQRMAHKMNLKDIIGYCRGIEKLVQRMRKDDSYINPQYLQAITGDADSMKYLVAEIEHRAIGKGLID